jgi:GNAT superfamily N-acetyltransferase
LELTTLDSGRSYSPHEKINMSSIKIVEVKNKSQLKTFLSLPHKIYQDIHSPYVMPLEMHLKMMMGKLGTPEKHFFLAYVNEEPVARLGVKVHATGSEKRLHFGFFEVFKDHPQAAMELINHSHALYPDLEMMGPFHFRQEDPYIGILVEGFEHDPYFMMPYNPPSYDQILKNSGCVSVMDLYTYALKKSENLPTEMIEHSKKSRSDLDLTFRHLDKNNLESEARIIAGIFNEALKNNWGFEEFLEDQLKEMVTMFKLFIDPKVVILALKDGKEIGCLLMIPNYNHLIKACRGKLTLGLLWRYLRRHSTTDSIRGYALGVLKEFQGKGVGSALTDEMYRRCQNNSYENCEVSWVLANNSSMNDLAKGMGGKRDKIYRIYTKSPILDAMRL